MSMTKLTLNADAALIGEAKRLAADNHTSVSALFSRLMATMTGRAEQEKRPTLGPLTRQATGLLRLPSGRAPKDILTDALSEKYKLNQ